MESVFITGADGFVGSHFVEYFVKKGAKVKAFVMYNPTNSWGALELLDAEVKKSVEVVFGDIRDSIPLRRESRGCDVFIHLAALISGPYSLQAPESYLEVNVRGTLNALQAALENGAKKFVLFSSRVVYGKPKVVPMDEKHPLDMANPYAASKLSAEAFALAYNRAFGLPVTIFRPFNIYGPRQSTRAVVPTIVSQALFSEKIRIGSLDAKVDLVYVEDVVEAVAKSLSKEDSDGEIFNIGYGKAFSIKEIIDMVLKITGKELEVVVEQKRLRKGEDKADYPVCDFSKAKEILGWKPKVSLEEGLRRLVDWSKHHPEFYGTVERYAI